MSTRDTAVAATGGAPGTPATRGGPATRERILATAGELFYAHGMRAISADRVIERVGITKVTFYRHFRTKDDLLVAYLRRRAAHERDAVAGLRSTAGDDLPRALQLLAHGIGAETCRPGFRGCPFINAAAEFAEGDHPVRRVVAEHRAWFVGELRELLSAAGIERPDAAADQLMMLRDGATVAGYLGDAEAVGRDLEQAALAVVAAHRPTG
ncbi:TetR/AcrR family transcriptional regulator [Streptomyces bohaiensis]|uniref:TetR/AcrR family transcriptional regulator n=1 Tax=Streptomyces bohaiensis TaxID=1431344 RepID=UPI003B7677B4